ncbi:MAG: T9SS type A sorting domain-containing protein, partial [Candidatus Electryonea clarkiae]|nr:T9SS type A sorting domain-containing protein [Candidatus Electryonea clarkiae]
FTLRHSRVINTEGILFRSSYSRSTIENNRFTCSARGGANVRFSSCASSIFRNNHADSVGFQSWETQLESCYGNRLRTTSIIDAQFEFHDNFVAAYFNIDDCDFDVHDNEFMSASVSGSNGTFENNRIYSNSRTSIDEGSDIVFRNNTITPKPNNVSSDHYSFDIDRDCEVLFESNLVVSSRTFIYLQSPLELSNNTFLFGDGALDLGRGSRLDAINNIFSGDGVNCPLIYSIDGGNVVINRFEYNTVHNISEIYSAFDFGDLDESNLFTNPRFNGGDPFDYFLQANSPCIDAGDPDSPDDPDETRADIGAFFYDQSIDNPPALISPFQLIEQAGTEFNYSALCIDDEGPLTFQFQNLPDWLEEDENNLAWVADSAVISGTIPDDINQFEFQVLVEDGLGQSDSAEVFCEVVQYTLLRGDTSGILSVEDSPFLVVEDVNVLEGDSLVIEPGCELYFHFVEYEDARIGIDVYGTLIAEGTVDDSIKFLLDSNEAVSNGFRGLRFFTNPDTSRYNYVAMNYATYGAKLDSTSISIENSTFLDVQNTIDARATSSVRLDSSTCIQQQIRIFVFIYSFEGNLEVTNSQFYGTEDEAGIFPIRCHRSTALIQDNLFDRGQYVILAENEAIFNRNCLYNVALNMHNVVNVVVSNNLFAAIYQNQFQPGLSLFRMPATIANNLFVDNSTGALIHYFEEGDSLPQFVNNVFMSNEISVLTEYQDFNIPSFQYNCLFDNDSISETVLLDTTNLFLDPEFADTIQFMLSDSSRLINAGHPDSAYNDLDGSRNDIGLWGGPYATAIEDTDFVFEPLDNLQTQLSLGAPYPNPFNSSQTFYFSLPKAGDVTIKLYNLLGQRVLTQHLPALQAGVHMRTLNASTLSSGVYFLELSTREEKHRTKVILLR